MLIRKLRQALTAITDQDVAHTRASAEMEVQLRKELLEANHRLAELEPAWKMFIAEHNDEEEAQALGQRRREAEVAQPSERRNWRLENEANRVELRGMTSMPPSDAAVTKSQLATPRGTDNDQSGARDPARHRPLEQSRPQFLRVLKVLECPVPPWPRSTPTRRVLC
jgi:hypothetical protein